MLGAFVELFDSVLKLVLEDIEPHVLLGQHDIPHGVDDVFKLDCLGSDQIIFARHSVLVYFLRESV